MQEVHFDEETCTFSPEPPDYLPDYGVVFNDSGHGEAHLGYIFGYTQERARRGRFVRPAFLQKALGLPKYVYPPSSNPTDWEA